MFVSTRSARLLIVLAAGSVISMTTILPSVLHAQNAPAAGAGAAATATDAPKRPQADMQAMNRAMTGLKANISDATKNTASLELVGQLLTASIASKGDMPPTIAALPDAEKQTRLADYRKEMNKLIRQELDLEDALLSNDNAKAAEALTALSATQAEGHGQFRGRGGQRGGGGQRGPAVPGGTDAGGMRGTGANGGAPAAPARGQ